MRNYYRLLCALLLGLLLSPSLSSQTQTIDSLEQMLANAQPGLDEIDILLGLSRAYLLDLEDSDQSLAAADLAIQRSKAIGNVDGEIEGLVFKGQAIKSFDEGEKYIQQALHLAQQSTSKDVQLFSTYIWAEFVNRDLQVAIDTLLPLVRRQDASVSQKNLANAYKVIGYNSAELGDYEAAILYLEKAATLFQSFQTSQEIDPKLKRVSAQYADYGLHNLVQCYIYLGRAYDKMGYVEGYLKSNELAKVAIAKLDAPAAQGWVLKDLSETYIQHGAFEEALELLQQADSIFRTIDRIDDIGDLNYTRGIIFMDMGDYQQAEKYLQKAYDYFKTTTSKWYLELVDLGQLYIITGQKERAKMMLSEAYDWAIEFDDLIMVSEIQATLAKLQIEEGYYENAVAMLQNCMKILKQVKAPRGIAALELNLSRAYTEGNQLDKAIYHANRSLDMFVSFNDELVSVQHVYLHLSKVYEKAKDPLAALTNFKQYHLYKDSLYTLDAQQKLKEEQVRQNVFTFQTEKEMAEREAVLLSQQNKLYLALAAALLGILLLGGYLYWQLRKTRGQLEIQNEQLTNLNQTKDKFFSIIAHDIRSPIVALDGVGQQMSFYLKKERYDRLLKLSSLVDSTAKRLNALLDNLLNWALLQTGTIPYHPKVLHTEQVVQEIFSIFQPVATLKNIELITTIPPQQKVYADEAALSTILRNLISNALKFTPENGTVSITTKAAGAVIEFLVNDTGTGIAANRLKKMFSLEKKSTKGTKGEKGTGLGLMLCKELIELNKGAIKVESELGKGTTFTFSMPKAA